MEQPTTSARLAVTGVAAAGVAALALAVAVQPRSALVIAPAAIVAAAASALRDRVRVRPSALGFGAAALAIIPLVAVRPVEAVVLTASGATAALAVNTGLVRVPTGLRERARRHTGIVVLAGVAAVAAFAQWPVTTVLVALVLTSFALARAAPAAMLALATLLFGFEGSIKLLLVLEPTPLPGGGRAVGAAALDVILFTAVAGIIVRDGLRTPRLIWARAKPVERAAIAMLGFWLAASVIQIAQGADLARGFEGFRLFQAYSLIAVAVAIAFAASEVRPWASRLLLLLVLPVTLYAAFRVVVGPSDAEFAMATSFETVTRYGGITRAVGSFTSAVGMASFLTPIVPFALVYGFFVPRARRLAWSVAAMAIVGIVGSYSRAALLGMTLGLLCMLVVVVTTSSVPLRRKLASAGLVVVILGGTYGGVQAATHASDRLKERARGLLHPLEDKSVKLRFTNWGNRMESIADHPLGHGVGSAGAASISGPGQRSDRLHYVITDNTFIKVLYEQGIAIGAVFLAALLATVVFLARRLSRLTGEARAVGVAALAGFVAFLGLAVTGEYVEQPGKVLAWGLLGIAVAQSLAYPETRARSEA